MLTRVDSGQLSDAEAKQEVRKNAEVVRKLRNPAGGAPIGNQNASSDKNNRSNTTVELGRGAAYALARLDRDRPDLAERVRADLGELLES